MAYTFDGTTKRISFDTSTTEVSVQDLYSRWVDWIAVGDNNKYLPAIRIVGGDPLPGSKQLGITYFLLNGWKIRPYEESHTVVFTGNLYSEDGSSPYAPVLGNYNVSVISSVSNLVDSTIAQMPEIEYASFNNCVTIDTLNGVSGIVFPAGTSQSPVNNINDAITIANSRGFNTLKFLNEYTFITGTSLIHFKVYGTGMQHFKITAQPGCDFTGTQFFDATYTGTFVDPAGFTNARLQNIVLDTLDSDRGEVLCEACIVQTEVKISSNNNAILDFLNCWSFPDVITGQPPRMDMNTSSANINFRNHSGGIKILNNNKPNEIRIYLNSGRIQLDSTITAGNFLLIGVGTLANNTTSVTSLDYSGLLSKSLVSLAVWDESLASHTNAGTTGRALSLLQFSGKIWLDPTSSYSGIDFPAGTQGAPVNNPTDALQIAIRENISEFMIQGEFTTNISLFDFTVGGDTFLDDSIIFNNGVYSNVTFRNLHLSGGATFINCEFIGCFIENIEGLSGEMVNCRLSNYIAIPLNGRLSGVEIVIEGDNTVIDNLNVPGTVSLDINSGYVLFTNCVAGCLLEMNLKGGEVELDTTCTGGEYYFEGMGTLYNNSTMTKKDNHLIALETIPGPIWEEPLNVHTRIGTAGKALASSSTGGVDYSLLSQAVWDELLAGHATNDTAGFIMKQIVMLADELHKIQGLDSSNPMNVTPTERTAGGIVLDISGDGKTSTTVTRQ